MDEIWVTRGMFFGFLGLIVVVAWYFITYQSEPGATITDEEKKRRSEDAWTDRKGAALLFVAAVVLGMSVPNYYRLPLQEMLWKPPTALENSIDFNHVTREVSLPEPPAGHDWIMQLNNEEAKVVKERKFVLTDKQTSGIFWYQEQSRLPTGRTATKKFPLSSTTTPAAS